MLFWAEWLRRLEYVFCTPKSVNYENTTAIKYEPLCTRIHGTYTMSLLVWWSRPVFFFVRVLGWVRSVDTVLRSAVVG